MGFEALLGNERLRQNLHSSLSKGRISHFYLISGPVGSGKHTLARLLAAAILCRGSGKPCRGCEPCRKVMANTHPDFITIDDPEKKTVPVDLIRQARADIYIQPNEADHKIYLFPRAQDMGIPSQNALLKVLEEPPAYGVFILLTDNPEKLLPTVRSRCTELALQPLPDSVLRRALGTEFPDADAEAVSAAISRSGGYLGQARELLSEGENVLPQTEGFVDAFARRDAMGLISVLVPMEKWKRDQLIPVLQQWTELLENALSCRSGMSAVNPLAKKLAESRRGDELLSAIRHLQKCAEYAQGNVSPAAICGYLQWVLR
jgi:DNA polymerase-3 subunit delta'